MSDFSHPELETLRTEIQDIDRQMAELLVKRQRLAHDVIDCKIKHGLPMRNHTQEAKVIERIAHICEDFDGKPHWGEGLAKYLIDCSLQQQSTKLEQIRKIGVQRIFVIGGLGKMGRWVTRFLQNQGHNVSIFDPHGSPGPDDRLVVSLAEGLQDCDMCIISAPLHAIPEVLSAVVEQQPSCVICDLGSLKNKLGPIFQRAKALDLAITSIHPLFGPNTPTLYGRNIVLCSLGHKQADDAICALFGETAVNLVDSTPEEHDRLMTLTLGFSHALSLIFGRALSRSGLSLQSLAKMSSTTYLRQIATTVDVMRENMELYFEIQTQCEHQLIYDALAREVQEFREMVESNDMDHFLNAMAEAVAYFRDA